MPTTFAKPPGLPVFPPHDDPHGDCLLARLIAEQPHRAEVAWPEGFEGGVAHRLDTDTSGAVLIADDLADLATLRGWFAAGKLVKTYLFVAGREVAWSDNHCERSIAHDKTHRNRMIVQRGPATPHRGRWYVADTWFSRRRGRLWEAQIRTGVTHQIRAHAAFLGIPLAGDKRYGGGEPPENTPPGVAFCLHHAHTRGPDGFTSDPVDAPDWAW